MSELLYITLSSSKANLSSFGAGILLDINPSHSATKKTKTDLTE